MHKIFVEWLNTVDTTVHYYMMTGGEWNSSGSIYLMLDFIVGSFSFKI